MTGGGVAFDRLGNVVVSGSFYATWNSGLGPLTSTTPGAYDVWVAKDTASGSPLWYEGVGGSGSDMGYGDTGAAVDPNGNPIVTGVTSGGDFGGTTLTSAG